jgi:hypothetical protein
MDDQNAQARQEDPTMPSAITPRDSETGVHIRMPAQLLDDLREVARENDRPMAREIRRALKLHVRRQRQEADAA